MPTLTFVENVSPSTQHQPQPQQQLFVSVRGNVRRQLPLETVIQAVASTMTFVENVFPSTLQLHLLPLHLPPPPQWEHVPANVPELWPLVTVTSAVPNTMMCVVSAPHQQLLLQPTFHLLDRRGPPWTSDQELTGASQEDRTALLCLLGLSLQESSKTIGETNLEPPDPMQEDLLPDETRDSLYQLQLQQNNQHR